MDNENDKPTVIMPESGSHNGRPNEDKTPEERSDTEQTVISPSESSSESTEIATGLTGPTGFGAAAGLTRSSGENRVIKDRFVLEGTLGKGGMGQVFRALDLRKQEADDAEPYVAIKFLGDAFSQHPQALISLQREAKKTQQLAHPNIVTVYDFDRDGTHVYMTMELLDGAPLSKWKSIDFNENREPDIEGLIVQLASGLSYAHSNGFIHSDLKPDNVFVTRDGRVKILDFGIARLADATLSNDSFDAGDLGALTTRYASLEMLQRSTEPHPADDIYALGIMAYQLYAGEHPFGGASALEAYEQKLQPKPLKDVPGYRWRCIQQALNLERKGRTQSADEFLAVFSGSRRRRKVLYSAVGVLLLSSVFFAYLSTQESGPSVPFEELPAPLQAEISDKLERGNQSLEILDWDGASRYFMDVWELHPRNPEAKAGLQSIVDQLEMRMENASSQRERAFLLRMFDAYAEHPFFAGDKRFRKLHDQLATALE